MRLIDAETLKQEIKRFYEPLTAEIFSGLVDSQEQVCCDNCYWNYRDSCTGATVGGVCELWKDKELLKNEV